jgi:Na+/H+-dicarboxylate symporter
VAQSSAYASLAHAQHAGAVEFVMNVIPKTIVGSFADGNVLQIIFFAVLFGAAMAKLGERGRPVIDGLEMYATSERTSLQPGSHADYEKHHERNESRLQ